MTSQANILSRSLTRSGLGFPIWTALQAPTYNHRSFRALVSEGQRVTDPSILTILKAAHRLGVFISFSFSD
jgi:hypothetical protein